MTKFSSALMIVLIVWSIAAGQTKTVPRQTTTPASVSPSRSSTNAAVSILKGAISANVYTNKFLGFTSPVPDGWTIATDEFANYMRVKGVDISAKPPKAADFLSQKKVDANFKKLTILLTAYRSLPGTPQNSMFRIAAEDIRNLNTNRPVKDGVDYVDLMRSQLASVRMPASYKYSDTQAEKLGPNQFAYIDTADNQGKTRIYVTVRKGFAILFSLDYVADDDLETLRDILARANFALK